MIIPECNKHGNLNKMHNFVKTALCPRTVTLEFNIPATNNYDIYCKLTAVIWDEVQLW